MTFAFEILSDAETHADATIRVALVQGLAKAAGQAGMVGGQMLDIEAETQANSNLSDIVRIQSLKTGALFRFACEAGAVLGQGDPAPLRRYADAIGLAFQIADDILDVSRRLRRSARRRRKTRAWARPPSSTSWGWKARG